MSKVLKSGKPFGKRSDMPLDFLIRQSVGGAVQFDKPISREILGPPKSVKVFGEFGPETAILRPCKCDWCGRRFDNHGPSVLCPTCMDAIDFAMEKTAGVPEGNLPALVSRTTKETKVREGTGVRPKVSKHDTGESIFRG